MSYARPAHIREDPENPVICGRTNPQAWLKSEEHYDLEDVR